MDTNEAESADQLDRGTSDARGPFSDCQFSTLVVGWQGGRVGLGGQNSQALGCGDENDAPDAPEPFELDKLNSPLFGP